MTVTFVICIVLFIAAYDSVLYYKKKKAAEPDKKFFELITDVMKRQYRTFIFTPFSVGVIFLGHFLDLVDIVPRSPKRAITLAGIGVIVFIISVIMSKEKIKLKKWQPILVILAGYIAGDCLW